MSKRRSDFAPHQGFSKQDWDEVSDNAEITAEEFAAMRPFAVVFPKLAKSIRDDSRRRRQPPSKEAISIRLDIDLVEKLRASGPGWQSRVNQALRDWLEQSPA